MWIRGSQRAIKYKRLYGAVVVPACSRMFWKRANGFIVAVLDEEYPSDRSVSFFFDKLAAQAVVNQIMEAHVDGSKTYIAPNDDSEAANFPIDW